MTRFEKLEGYPEEIQGRFNSFITTQFDDSLSVEMQIRSLIQWITSSRDLINDIVDYINLFIEMFDERLQEEIVEHLNVWLTDGTLAQIINNDVFGNKADKSFVVAEIQTVINQLNQKADKTVLDEQTRRLNVQSKKLNVQPKTKTRAIATIIWDDGFIEDYTTVFPFMKSLGVMGGTAVIQNKVGTSGYMTLNQMREMQSEGWEFLSHTLTHPDLRTISTAELHKELGGSKEFLTQNGIEVNGLVYSYNRYNNNVLELAREYYDYAFSKDEDNQEQWENIEPINQYGIYRIDLEFRHDVFLRFLDDAIEKSGWIVLMGHGHYYNPSRFPTDEVFPGKWSDNIANMKENIQYLINQGVEILTPKKAIEKIGNSITIGDDRFSNDYFRLSKTGRIESSQLNKLGKIINYQNVVRNNTKPSFFEPDSLTVSTYKTDESDDFPTKGGRLHTFNYGNPSDFIHQIWYPYNLKNMYIRNFQSWVNGGTWGEWQEIKSHVKTEGTFNVDGSDTGITANFSSLGLPRQVDSNYGVIVTTTWDSGGVYTTNFTQDTFQVFWEKPAGSTKKVSFKVIR